MTSLELLSRFPSPHILGHGTHAVTPGSQSVHPSVLTSSGADLVPVVPWIVSWAPEAWPLGRSKALALIPVVVTGGAHPLPPCCGHDVDRNCYMSLRWPKTVRLALPIDCCCGGATFDTPPNNIHHPLLFRCILRFAVPAPINLYSHGRPVLLSPRLTSIYPQRHPVLTPNSSRSASQSNLPDAPARI